MLPICTSRAEAKCRHGMSVLSFRLHKTPSRLTVFRCKSNLCKVRVLPEDADESRSGKPQFSANVAGKPRPAQFGCAKLVAKSHQFYPLTAWKIRCNVNRQILVHAARLR
jgi:hypothetical protein